MLESKQRQIADAEKLPIPTVQAIIDGELTGALSGKTLAVVSPMPGSEVSLPEAASEPTRWGDSSSRAAAALRKACTLYDSARSRSSR